MLHATCDVPTIFCKALGPYSQRKVLTGSYSTIKEFATQHIMINKTNYFKTGHSPISCIHIFIWDHIHWKHGPSEATQLPLQSYLMSLDNT